MGQDVHGKDEHFETNPLVVYPVLSLGARGLCSFDDFAVFFSQLESLIEDDEVENCVD